MEKLADTLILVTGGAGFIGSHIVDRLMKDGARVRVLDDMSNGRKSNIDIWKNDNRFEFVLGDIRDRDIVKHTLEGVSVVFHEAAKVSVPFSVENPEITFDINAVGTLTLLDECRKNDVEKVIVASSSSVYGDTPILPKVEEMKQNPLSPYGVSKLAEECLSVAFHYTYGMDTTALRYFNVYGPRQRSGAYAGVISIFISQALQNKPLTIDGDGKQTRDFTFVEDVVQANILTSISTKANGEVLNIGGGSQITIENLADLIIQLTNSSSQKIYNAPRLGDVRDSLAGIKKASDIIGYSPKTSLRDGLNKTLQWVKAFG